MMLNQISSQQFSYIQLWYLVQHSLSSFRKLVQYFGSAEEAVLPQNLAQWSELKIHKSHIIRAAQFDPSDFDRVINTIVQLCDFICTEKDSIYPQQLLNFNDCPPILFGQGNSALLNQPQIAVVGSRKVTADGRQLSYEFSHYLSSQGFVITSGLADGVDAAAHHAGLEHQKTIAVMATGIEKTYPSYHINLRKKILDHSGTIITEFLPFTAPIPRNFPRRNRIVSGMSLGVLVTEAALKSGSLGTARHASEQGKLIFAIPGHIKKETSKGCHLLIREGAILVDQPEQILEDIALPAHWQISQSMPKKIEIPPHLIHLYNHLDWTGQDIDALASLTQLPTYLLTAQLMELEILELCTQQFGKFMRTPKVADYS